MMTNRALRTGVGSQWPHSDAQKKTTTTIAYGLTLLDLINTALKSVGVHCAEEKLRRAMILGWRNIPIALKIPPAGVLSRVEKRRSDGSLPVAIGGAFAAPPQ